MKFGWEQSEAAPTMPIPNTLLELAMPIAPFCPLSLVHITLSCGTRANFHAIMVSQKTKTVWIRGLHLQFADGKTRDQSFCGGNLLFPCTEKNCERDILAPKSKACVEVLAVQLHLQLHHESGPVSAMGSLWLCLVQSTDNWLSLGEKGKRPLESDRKFMYAATWDKRQKVKGACRRLLQHVHKGQGVTPFCTWEPKPLLQLTYIITLTSFPVTFQQTAVYCKSLIVYVGNNHLSVGHFLRINGQLERNWWPEVKPEAIKNTWSFNHLNAA